MPLSSPQDRNHVRLDGLVALITGVGGFLGRRLATRLNEAGAVVVGLDLPEACPPLASPIECHQADLLRLERLSPLLTSLSNRFGDKIAVFHLAGQAHVGKCREQPLQATALNVTATMHLLEACRQTVVRRVVFPSTGLVYRLPASGALDEDSPVWPKSVYAATKLAAEALLTAYAASYGFSCRVARLANVYGAGSVADSVAGLVFRQVREGGPVRLKTLAPVRDFIYQDDVVRGLIALATRPDGPGCAVFNLSSGVPTSIRELAETACRVQGLSTDIVETGVRAEDSDDRLLLSNQRLRSYAGWEPVWALEAGLRQTLAELALNKS